MRTKEVLQGGVRCLYLLLYVLCIFSTSLNASAEIVVVVKLADDSTLTVNSPPPVNRLPVLFVHGYNGNINDKYKDNWQDSRGNLPSFMQTLNHKDNSCLGIEPYYIHFNYDKRNRIVEEDAAEIDKAINLILDRHSKVEPNQKKVKVAVIAFSKGTISTRYYLKHSMTKVNGSYPVSEFIAISPPNHGFTQYFASLGYSSKNPNYPTTLLFRQLCNGYKDDGTTFNNDEGKDFMKDLNSPDMAPHSRGNGEPVENGILYVCLYANMLPGNDPRDMVGGEDPSNDPYKRMRAKNMSPNAVNIEVKEVPDENIPKPSDFPWLKKDEILKIAVHRNTVHTPRVIFNALYTVVHHQAPPSNISYATDGNIPIIPLPGNQTADAGAVLLFDTSGSMSWAHDGTLDVDVNRQRLTLAKRAAKPFLHILNYFMPCKANFGISVFPRKPKAGCNGQVIQKMTPITKTTKENAIETIRGLEAGGNTPLLAGLETAASMFGNESNKTIILLSDGYHNCPYRVNSNDPDIGILTGIKVYTIGFGQAVHVDHTTLNIIAENNGGEFFDVTDLGYDPANTADWDPGNALNSTYKEILVSALGLQEAADPMGVIKKGDTITNDVKINKRDKKICFYLSWKTPQDNRLGLKIKSSDNKEILPDQAGVHLLREMTYKIFTIDKPFLNIPGKVGSKPWVIEIVPGESFPGGKENYQYGIIMDSDLELKTSFDKAAYKTGDTMTITAKITDAGQPVTGLTNIKLKITRPGDGIGNWYAANKISDEQLASIPAKIGEETVPRIQRKAVFLLSNPKNKVVLPAPTGPKTFNMNDDGKNGDAKSGDGIYTTRYDDTIKEGTYSFYIQATSNNNSPSLFDREDLMQKYITVNAAPQHSDIDVKLKDTSVSKNIVSYHYEIKVAPKDRFGNYMRPGHTVQAAVTFDNSGTDPVKLKDNLDGIYSGNSLVISETDIDKGAKLVISLDGKNFTAIDKLPGASKCSISLHAGKTLPTGTFNTVYNGHIGLGLDLDYRLSHQFSLTGFLGYNRFKSVPPLTGYTQWWNVSLNLKYKTRRWFLPIYINSGPGLYISKTGTLEPGFNAGLGIAFPLPSRFSFELGTDYHHIFTGGVDTTFWVAHVGLISRL